MKKLSFTRVTTCNYSTFKEKQQPLAAPPSPLYHQLPIAMAQQSLKDFSVLDLKKIVSAVILPRILVEKFPVSPRFINLVSKNQYVGTININSHAHIRNFLHTGRTMKEEDMKENYKLILFLFSLCDKAR